MERIRKKRSRKTRILIIRFSSIGDIVLTTPVIRCLKEQIPNAEIHYLTKKAFRNIVEPNPHVDHVHFLRSSLASTVFKLQTFRFDHIIDLHHNLRTFFIKNSINGQKKSFSKLNYEKWMMVNFKVNKLPDMHIVDRYMKAVEHLGVQYDQKGLDFFIDRRSESAHKTLPEKFREKKYAVIVVGAKHNTKRIPSFIIEDSIQYLDIPILLIGSKVDYPRATKIAKKYEDKVYNACGRYSVGASAALIKNAEFVITPDTGMMHIAAAFQKDMISIWGNTIPEFGMYPFYADDELQNNRHRFIENKSLSCRPCSKIGYKKCPKKHFKCMMDLDAAFVLNKIKTFPHLKDYVLSFETTA